MTFRESLSAVSAWWLTAARRVGQFVGVEDAARRRAVLPKPSGHEPFRVPIAGVAHRDRDRLVRRLVLGELVRLRRDPRNEADPNAIAVEARSGHRLGFVPQRIAARLVPHVEERQGPLDAAVTELTGDVQGNAVAAALTVYLPAVLAADLLGGQAQGWEYCCDTVAEGATYLMLNCDEAELTRVIDALGQNGLPPGRSGFSYRPASDGRQYRWYVRLEGTVANERLGQLLDDTLGASRRDIAVSRYIEQFEPENQRLRDEIRALRGEKADLRERIRALEEARNAAPRPSWSTRSRGAEVEAVMNAVFPDVRLLRDSLSVMEREIESCEPVFRALRVLRWEPPAFPPGARPLQTAPGWREVHFRTGQRDDGRLYFLKRDGKWNVLVSFKGCQERDLEFLSRH